MHSQGTFLLDGGPDPPTGGALLKGMTSGFSRMSPSTVPSGPNVRISPHAVDHHSNWPAVEAFAYHMTFPQWKIPLQCGLSSKFFDLLFNVYFCIVVDFSLLVHIYFNQATGYASQHVWCLSQASINYEGCGRKGFRRKNIQHLIFADDKQLFASNCFHLPQLLKHMRSRRWWSGALLPSRTGVRLVGWNWMTERQKSSGPALQQLAGVDLNLSVGSDTIRPSSVVRDLGVFVDAELTFYEHVRRVTTSCFFQLHRLCEIRKHVNRQVTLMKQLVQHLSSAD